MSGSPFFTNQTFQAVLVRAGVDGLAGRIGWLALSVGLLVLAVPAIRRAPAPLALVATAGVGLLISPTSWSHHWVWVAPALLVAAATAWRTRSRVWTVVTLAVRRGVRHRPAPAGLPRAGDRELSWTPLQQVVGSTYVWFTTLLFVLLWFAWRRRGWDAHHEGSVARAPSYARRDARRARRLLPGQAGRGARPAVERRTWWPRSAARSSPSSAPTLGVKCGRDSDEAAELRHRYPDHASVMAYIGRHGWNTVVLDGTVPDDELRELVDASYDAVVAKLPKRLRPGP